MFEAKENTSGEIKSTTFLGSGREPCQQAVQDFLGERLSHISNFSFLSISCFSSISCTISHTISYTISYEIYRVEVYPFN